MANLSVHMVWNGMIALTAAIRSWFFTPVGAVTYFGIGALLILLGYWYMVIDK